MAHNIDEPVIIHIFTILFPDLLQFAALHQPHHLFILFISNLFIHQHHKTVQMLAIETFVHLVLRIYFYHLLPIVLLLLLIIRLYLDTQLLLDRHKQLDHVIVMDLSSICCHVHSTFLLTVLRSEHILDMWQPCVLLSTLSDLHDWVFPAVKVYRFLVFLHICEHSET